MFSGRKSRVGSNTLGYYLSLQVTAAHVSKRDSTFHLLANFDKHVFFLTLCFLEGKGPEKEKYEQKIAKLNLKRVAFRTMWLEPEDYPLLLGMSYRSIVIFFVHLKIVFKSFVPLYRISRPWCLLAYILVRVGSSNEGFVSTFLKSRSQIFCRVFLRLLSRPRSCNFPLGCGYVWLWITGVCCFILLVRRMYSRFSFSFSRH